MVIVLCMMIGVTACGIGGDSTDAAKAGSIGQEAEKIRDDAGQEAEEVRSIEGALQEYNRAFLAGDGEAVWNVMFTEATDAIYEYSGSGEEVTKQEFIDSFAELTIDSEKWVDLSIEEIFGGNEESQNEIDEEFDEIQQLIDDFFANACKEPIQYTDIRLVALSIDNVYILPEFAVVYKVNDSWYFMPGDMVVPADVELLYRRTNVYDAITIASAINSALAVEAAYNAMLPYKDTLIGLNSSELDALPQEFTDNMMDMLWVNNADDIVIRRTSIGETGYAIMVDAENNKVNVYISTDDAKDAWLVVASGSDTDNSVEYTESSDGAMVWAPEINY
ncbi:MAG: hypothetical protein IJ648_08220 [Lachnospiraceae bacterium]|nr:hypothetical protein [Lachnospiraceae bacterium]